MKKKTGSSFPAGKLARNLLPGVLQKIRTFQEKSLNRFSKVWGLIVGDRYSKLTKVIKLEGETLYVKIDSAPLYAIFSSEEKKIELLQKIQQKIPDVTIKTIAFRR